MKKQAFQIGDKVRLTGKFLRNTGQYTSDEARKVWTITGIDGSFVVTDEERSELSYWTAEELETDPTLRFRRIHSDNLIKVGKPDHS
jgi:hypothetical protein